MTDLDTLFHKLLEQGATDLHLHESEPPLLRLHGRLVPMDDQPPLDRETIRSLMQEVCDPVSWQEFESNGEIDFGHTFRDLARFRVSYNKHYQGYGAVFRWIPAKIMSFEEIRAPESLRSFARYSSGLCLLTGATGVGKTTTLASLIEYINATQRRTIMTIEEPIEYVFTPKKSMIVQREVGVHVASFSEGVRGALRQDVEVVLVGEMRDLETIELAVTAAEKGLLVFSTLHTNSVVNTVDRIIDVFPPDQQRAIREALAVVLRAVCCQLLLPRADGTGRVPAHEILVQTPAVSNMIRERQTPQLNQVIQSGRALGMQLMDDNLETLVQRRLITGSEAYMKANDKSRFMEYAPVHHRPVSRRERMAMEAASAGGR